MTDVVPSISSLFLSLKNATLCTYSGSGVVIFYKEPVRVQDGNICILSESMQRFEFDVLRLDKFFEDLKVEYAQRYLERFLPLVGWKKYRCIFQTDVYSSSGLYIGYAQIAFINDTL